MVSAKQKVANKANALKSIGPKTANGRSRASLNATKHGLSLPVDDLLFTNQIQEIASLVREDCVLEHQAVDIAKRIIDFERNEAFLVLKFLDQMHSF